MTIDISKMTAEEKMAMLKALKEEEEATNNERAKYKELVKELVKKHFTKAKYVSDLLADYKAEVFEEFKAVLDLKAELYGIKENQQSHTFTTDEGQTIVIGHRVIDNFDDTVHTGIAKVKQYIQTIVSVERRKEIEMMLDVLLKKDKNGNMRASRVLELEKMAAEIDNYDFKDGVKIIRAAYKPVKSSTFVEVSYKDKEGKKIYIPLSIVAVDENQTRGEVDGK